MIRLASTVALAGVLAIGFAGPLPAFAANPDTSSTTGATSHNPPSQHQQAQSGDHTQSGDHAKTGMTKQHTGSGDTGYGDRAPDVVNQNGMGRSPGSTSTHR